MVNTKRAHTARNVNFCRILSNFYATLSIFSRILSNFLQLLHDFVEFLRFFLAQINPTFRHFAHTFPPAKPELFSCCLEYLAATKANQSYFQLTIIFLAIVTTGQTKGYSFLRNYSQIVTRLSNTGTTVAPITAVWIYLC
jgi:hypothetical protein